MAIIVNTIIKLQEICKIIEQNKIIGVDSEFCKGKFYHDKLSLIQIATSNEIYLIDLITNSLDISPLKKIFNDRKIIKVFCDFKQDYEILAKNYGIYICNISDIQFLFMAVFGERISYKKMVEKFFNIEIDKETQYSDWMQRPFSKEQIQYAELDVKYLIKIYEILNQNFNNLKYQPNLKAIIKQQIKVLIFKPNKFIILAASVKDIDLKLLKKILIIRDNYAKSLDIYPSWLVTDEDIINFVRLKDTKSLPYWLRLEYYNLNAYKDIIVTKREKELISKNKANRNEAESIYSVNKALKLYSKKLNIHIELIATKTTVFSKILQYKIK